jgi:hypothetical protein
MIMYISDHVVFFINKRGRDLFYMRLSPPLKWRSSVITKGLPRFAVQDVTRYLSVTTIA